MSSLGAEVDIRVFQAEADRVFPVWAADHVNDMIGVLPSNGSEYQDISVARFEARPGLETAYTVGTVGVGAAFGNMVDEFRDLGIVNLARKRAKNGGRTLISSLHLNNVMDAAATHTGLFVASEDEEFAQSNVLLANPMLAWTNILGFDTMPVLVASGPVVTGIPASGATKYGLSPELMGYHGKMTASEFRRLKNIGHIMHRATTGTRGNDIILEDGRPAKSVPRLSDKEARRVRLNYDVVVGVPMDVQKDGSVAEVLPPRFLSEDKDVHRHMKEMTKTIGLLLQKVVVYGMPEGAQPVE